MNKKEDKSSANRIHINVSKPYDIVVGRGLIDDIAPLIGQLCSGNKVAIITDDIVDELYGDIVLNQLNNEFDVYKYVFQNGERSKNINTLSDILEFLADSEFKRNDSIVALGGGVVGDIAGLSAALYVRGIKFIQIPTTLLAMVDASIGGKTAIDLKAGKNLAGVFWQPSLVICDVNIIRKLPDNIFKEGMGEVIKYDVIGNFGICDMVRKGIVFDNLDSIITSCIELKKRIVEDDEFETKGIRKLLNVGHTIAHGIERISDFSVPHGFAVGTGLVWEAAIAYLMDICDYNTFDTIKNTILKSELLVEFVHNSPDFINYMKKDKKNDDNRISFMLPSCLGDCKEYKIDGSELNSLIKQAGELL